MRGEAVALSVGASPSDGVPFIAVLNADGNMLANSMGPQGANMGYPPNAQELNWFMSMFKKGAPSLSSEQVQILETRVRRDIAEVNPPDQRPVNLLSADGNGRISDFEEDTIKSSFGAGWAVSTDSVLGGHSTAEMKLIEGGANGSKQALGISGRVSDGLQYAWAGAVFSPGPHPFAPADLAKAKSIVFEAKGDGRSYYVMLYTKAGGFMPAIQKFAPGSDWKAFRFPLSTFNGTDGHDVTGILFSAAAPAGEFSFAIDSVRVE